MNWKKFWLTALVVYIVLGITELITHSVILGGHYTLPGFRAEAQMSGFLWVFWVIGIVFSFFFTLIFAKGYEGRGLMEGIRYGFYIGFLVSFTGAYTQFVMYSIPYSLVWYWIILGIIQMVLCGMAAAMVYKPQAATA